MFMLNYLFFIHCAAIWYYGKISWCTVATMTTKYQPNITKCEFFDVWHAFCGALLTIQRERQRVGGSSIYGRFERQSRSLL